MSEIGTNAVGSIVATVLLALSPKLSPLPHEWSVPLTVATAAIAAALLIPTTGRVLRARRSRLAAYAFACFSVAVVAAVAWWNAGSVDRKVSAYASAICSDGLWVEHRAACYGFSEQHLVDSFEAYDPDRWHGWDEVGEAEAVPFLRFGLDGPVLAGKDLLTLGVIVGSPQSFGSTAVIQMRALKSSEASRLDVQYVGQFTDGVDNAKKLLAGTLSDDARPDDLIYCNLPIRPFFPVDEGRILAIKGTLLANGRTLDRVDGKPLGGSYVTCSSAEHIGHVAD